MTSMKATVTAWPTGLLDEVLGEVRDELAVRLAAAAEPDARADHSVGMARSASAIDREMLNEALCRGMTGSGGPLDPLNIKETVFAHGWEAVAHASSHLVMRTLDRMADREPEAGRGGLRAAVREALLETMRSGAPLGPVPSPDYETAAEIRCTEAGGEPWFVVTELEEDPDSLSGYAVCSRLFECSVGGAWFESEGCVDPAALSCGEAISHADLAPFWAQEEACVRTGLEATLALDAIDGDVASLACCLDMVDPAHGVTAPVGLEGAVESFRSAGIETVAGAAQEVSTSDGHISGGRIRLGEER